MTTTQPIIQVENLRKSYPGVCAVDGLTFQVQRGEIFGLLGPNGAGKTSTFSIIQGLLPADEGRVTILGRDVAAESAHIKRRIGVQLQTTSLLPELTALEQILLFARLYGRPLNGENGRRLLAQVDLTEKVSALPGEMSDGQQQRLSLALALVNDPEILFLDEPTAGLDPLSRRNLWALIRQLHSEGRTIVLTTHYLEEAEALCQRVGIISNGRLLALDSPDNLITQVAHSGAAAVNLEDVYLQLTDTVVAA
jgi:ABC-2 type transport system ATP-binding protein